jgi:UDP-3-O-[3-hydroxymyristoyl] N-acetylglucosamine deacetylase
VHSGLFGRVVVGPAPFGSGVVLGRAGFAAARVGPELALATPGQTMLELDGGPLHTVEHLLSAIFALGLTDLAVTVEGIEVPILDGSASRFVAGLLAAGRVDGPPLTPRALAEEVVVAGYGGHARAWPADGLSVTVDVLFPGGPTGRLTWPGPEPYGSAVAPARTFVFAHDVARLRAAGLGRGATPENTLVIGDEAAVPRFADEPVRHKLLDAIGDIALLGPVRAGFEIVRGSHALHLMLVRAVAVALPPG